MTIFEMYQKVCNQQTDINEHLPTLKRFAEECSHITEFGVRFVTSTWAFLSTDAKVISYDINANQFTQACKQICAMNGRDWTFNLDSTLTCEIEETDLLFIDTFHAYGQCKAELEKHSHKVRKYIAFHDSETWGRVSENGSPKGVMDAIEEFISLNPEWSIIEHHTNNNGLTIIGKI